MSEYQYYEWQTLDRPLTIEEQEAVNALSSHIEVTPTCAIVTYEWGDFKHNPREVLAKYFDAHLYVANWGSRTLMFRFPKGLLEETVVEPYCVPDHIEFEAVGRVQVLEISLHEEEGVGWVEAGSVLSSLARLRDDLIQGDMRLLYLAWLKAMQIETAYEQDEDDPDSLFNDHEPPLPAGLGKLNASLKRFVDVFDLDPFLVQAAAAASDPAAVPATVNFSTLLPRLSRAECDDFLLRLANNEPGVGAAFRKRLLSMMERSPAVSAPRRTIRELRDTAKELEEAEKQCQAEEKRKRHAAEMQALAKREAQVWQEVETLLQGYTAKAYDEATALLARLEQLSEFQGKATTFQQQVLKLAERYKSRTALIARWKAKGWV
jgi:hypothetical protein